MCFRPASVDAVNVCPVCGKKVHSVMGQMPSKCPFCKTDFSAQIAAAQNLDGMPADAPKAPRQKAPMPKAPLTKAPMTKPPLKKEKPDSQ